ncbi:MAG: NAD(P)H-dependent oxidoreductase [Alphaproteobacteria bacterium]|mgnify:CR=1 FL=1|nr:NAD(P)H-dependent oxidoreductase [Alphaproteobacteria bacterium]MBN9569456.1 NAD(P)H-dependent oxidoreductase [Alphaproteobacteria bacterium]
MRIFALSGSLRSASSNTAALRALASLAPPEVTVALYTGLGALPHFNADLDGDMPPAAVRALREAVGQADALIISSPEYARGIAGSLKNALDWLVGSDTFPGKPVAILNTSPRAQHADAHLRLTLSTMAAVLVPEADVTLPLIGTAMTADAIAADAQMSHALRNMLDALQKTVAG